MTRGLPALSLLSALAAGACAGGMTEIASRPIAEPINVDANQREWWGSLTEIGSDLSIGIRNDADDLYLSLMTSDRELVDQMMFQGLVVWFDPGGQKAESFGVRFPLGVMADGRPGSLGAGGGPTAGAPPEGLRPGELDPATRDRMYERSLAGGNLLVAPGDTIRITDEMGIAFEGRAEYGGFTYELRVPLRTGPGRPYAIGAEPGQTIAIGFATPEVDMDALLDRAAERSSADRPAGSAAGQPGGFGGRPGGLAGPGFSLPSPLEEWALVTLAAASAAGQ